MDTETKYSEQKKKRRTKCLITYFFIVSKYIEQNAHTYTRMHAHSYIHSQLFPLPIIPENKLLFTQ